MNLFLLDEDPVKSAAYYVDKHVVKMPTEHAQMLSYALHLFPNRKKGVGAAYKFSKSHAKHPISLWAQESLSNWLWMQDFNEVMLEEYTHRYKKSEHRAITISRSLPRPDIKDIGLTVPRQAMPEDLKHEDFIFAYRRFYYRHKFHLWEWKERPVPEWLSQVNYGR